jgi:hypothetical protein
VKSLSKVLFLFFISINLNAGGFEDLGNSARVFSMGGAYTAVADAPYTLFYNPAGIFNIDNLAVSTTYSNLYPGIQDDNLNYFSLSAAMPVGIIGSFGLGGTFLNTNFWKENTFIASYAREIYGSFIVGGSVKVLRWSAEPAPGESGLSYLGFTFDAGIHYTIKDIMQDSELRLGAAIHNITEPSIASNGSPDAKLPMVINAGAAYISKAYNYMIAVDVLKENDNLILRAGAEFVGIRQQLIGLSTGFLVRVGYNGIVNETDYKQSGLNGGFGLEVERLAIDYAYVFPLELKNVGGSHKISLSYNFNF